jgi:hypothetical protein
MSFQDIAQDGLPNPSQLPSPEPNQALELNSNPNDKLETRDKSKSVLEHEPGSNARSENDEPALGSDAPREPYDLVICSFALHLLASSSALYALLSTLSYGARWLVVLEPHKKPEVRMSSSWERSQGGAF